MMEGDALIQEKVVRHIKQDPLAAEFRLAIFSAALLSYRKNSCVLPFPSAFLDQDGRKNMHDLENVFNELTPLHDVIQTPLQLSTKALSLLHWIIHNKAYNVKCSEDSLLEELESKTGKASFNVRPDFIFELEYQTANSRKFDEYAKDYGVKLGYHGSRLDNFHSILHNGLQVHMTKNALFGEGIYLSEDLSVSLPYSKTGSIWSHSKLGQQMSCIAVCEIVDHPVVKCKVENSKSSRSRAKGTEAGDVPEKYFVVTSSEMVRLKYVLVFTKKKPKKRHQSQNWIFLKYPVASILFLYAVFLFFMGLWKSNRIQTFFRRYWVDRFLTDSDH